MRIKHNCHPGFRTSTIRFGEKAASGDPWEHAPPGFKPNTGDEVGSVRGGLRRHRGESERERPLTLSYPSSVYPKLFEPRKLSIKM